MAERVDRMIRPDRHCCLRRSRPLQANQSSSSLDSIHALSHENLAEMATTTAGIEGLRATANTLENQGRPLPPRHLQQTISPAGAAPHKTLAPTAKKISAQASRLKR